MSIFNGFREFAENKLQTFDPNIRVLPARGAVIQNADSLISIIVKYPETKSIMGVTQGKCVAFNGQILQPVLLESIDNKVAKSVLGIDSSIILGSFDVRGDYGLPSVVLGAGVADRLRIMTGDSLTLASPQMFERMVATHLPNLGVKVIVSGIFQTGTKDYDATLVYSNIKVGRQLFGINTGDASMIDLRLNSIKDVPNFKSKLEATLGDKYTVQTWRDLHLDLYNIMELERLATFVVLSLIIVVAVFNVLASLSMTVTEKKADIAILMAQGGTRRLIRNIYIVEGIIIGLIGSGIGTIAGVLLCFGQINYKWFTLDMSKYLIDSIPVIVYPTDVLIVFCFAVLLSIIAGIYPAYRASGVVIAKAVRGE
jgi:lipoprotein-releasing system permease protein